MTDETLELVFISEASERLDVAITALAKRQGLVLSRSQIKHLIKSGAVAIDGTVINRPAFSIAAGARITLQPPEEETAFESFEIPLDILHEDESVLVINKPAGLSMHPGAGNSNKTLANAVQFYIKDSLDAFPGGVRPGIVHRLDKDTTGVIVVARTVADHAHLSAQFAERTIERRYKALVAVTPRANRLIQREAAGTIETLIGRHSTDRRRQAVVQEGGRRAVTHWKRLDMCPYAALLELKLETGRTHQIRVHMDHVRSPVLGDKTYGSVDFLPRELEVDVQNFGRQALHATSLLFDHPVSGERLAFEVAPPPDMQALIQTFRNYRD